MTADLSPLLDGCPTCGDRSPVTDVHREACAAFDAARRAAQRVDGGIPAVAVDDLFAHITSPRCGGPYCTPEAAVDVVRVLSALGWRPTVRGGSGDGHRT